MRLFLFSTVGVVTCTFRIVTQRLGSHLGVVPVRSVPNLMDKELAFSVGGVTYWSTGNVWKENRHMKTGIAFSVGDRVAVTLDLDVDVVSFAKNGQRVGEPTAIAHEPYYFVFQPFNSYSMDPGNAVAIEGIGVNV